eukprot:gnl/TRDRNA2_/TRDRNA2_95092_c0_seq2.p1 gnl/TRDRNA2_/TRDRNA2_95092_c0~~gnl/TRDRNA2_/TRDRNA2_95092_c0_seq2.p1  ORF type:complete len:425 (+),score=67.51 gnl/TRDRNA2_/TRDRNA2_95092_c0_seq2:130-1404(+)
MHFERNRTRSKTHPNSMSESAIARTRSDGALPSSDIFGPRFIDLSMCRKSPPSPVAAESSGENPLDMFNDEGMGAPAPRPKRDAECSSPEAKERRQRLMEKVAQMAQQCREESESAKQALEARRHSRNRTMPANITPKNSLKGTQALDLNAAMAANDLVAELTGSTVSNEELHRAEKLDIASDSSIVVFDWDDTLFPTWFITNVLFADLPEDKRSYALCNTEAAQKYCTEKFRDMLHQHGQKMRQTLQSARQIGNVAIVTLARRPWVTTSADMYLPTLDFEDLTRELGIPIYYAREHVVHRMSRWAPHEGIDVYMIAKRNAIKRAIKDALGELKTLTNGITVGDSNIEHDALRDLFWCHEELHNTASHCKTVKFMDDPSCQELGDQLQVLVNWLKGLAVYPTDIDTHVGDELEEDGCSSRTVKA